MSLHQTDAPALKVRQFASWSCYTENLMAQCNDAQKQAADRCGLMSDVHWDIYKHDEEGHHDRSDTQSPWAEHMDSVWLALILTAWMCSCMCAHPLPYFLTDDAAERRRRGSIPQCHAARPWGLMDGWTPMDVRNDGWNHEWMGAAAAVGPVDILFIVVVLTAALTS